MLRVLNNKKSLENQKEEFLRWLKQQGVHSEIRNIIDDLLFGGFAGYQNDAVKHQQDKYTIGEIEFVNRTRQEHSFHSSNGSYNKKLPRRYKVQNLRLPSMGTFCGTWTGKRNQKARRRTEDQ